MIKNNQIYNIINIMKDNQSKTRTKNYNQTPFSQSLTISVICIPFSGILKLFCSRTRNTINILYSTAIIKIQRSTITRSSTTILEKPREYSENSSNFDDHACTLNRR